MTSVGTITFHESINYGAILQAYALQKILSDMGYMSEIIDYHNPQRGLSTLSPFRRLRHLLWQLVAKKIFSSIVRREKADAFCLKHLRLSRRKFCNRKALYEDPPIYDAYITGSDQVWNPRNNSLDSSYFLTFAPPGKIRISYAASFGVSRIEEKYKRDYGNWLKQIHFLSCREEDGKQIIEMLANRDSEVVLDPTLLLSQELWRQIAVAYESSNPYILCYYMPGDKKVNKSITRIAKQISTLTGWDIVCIGQKEYMRLLHLRCSIFDAGPDEFLGLFQNASFVVTNSFHGAAFSIGYEKPFFVPMNQSSGMEQKLNSRIINLLRTLNLEERFLPAGEDVPKKIDVEMEYRHVRTILREERQRSVAFLKNALGEVVS